MNEAGLRASPRDLDLQHSRSSNTAMPAASVAAPPKAIAATITAKPAPVTKPPAAAAAKRDVWQAHDVDPRGHVTQGTTVAAAGGRMSPALKRFVLVAGMIALMAGVFTAAQFIPAPDWIFSDTGTLVVESSPLGIKVSVNGKPQGVTPLTLKVESGIHEVELHGPGRPKVFKVHVTRGDRVAQYIEFSPRR
jgi:hypothetical protein